MADPTPENVAEDLPIGEPAAVAASAEETATVAPQDAAAAVPDLLAAEAAPPIPRLNSGQQAADELDLSHLPVHTRSMLRIEVTVSVTLARQRRPVQEITELGPGTLVKFEKTYDEPLELTVGELPIARGEVVKVGDKFGLRIGKLIRPHERFASIGK